ncbi:MAG: hypothetical protein RLZZ247_812 [Cyanobacteriota bacterium]|jgi:carboxymethylenebutenolidase
MRPWQSIRSGERLPQLQASYDNEGLALGRHHRDQVAAQPFLADMAAAAAWLQHQLQGDGLGDRPLGCVGFCFGGHLAMLAATLPVIGATCDFYGARVSTDRPGGGAPTLAVVEQIPGLLWCFCGDRDPLMPAEEIQLMKVALEQASGRHRHRLVMATGAGHGYMCEARPGFEPTCAAEGWAAMLELFAQAL